MRKIERLKPRVGPDCGNRYEMVIGGGSKYLIKPACKERDGEGWMIKTRASVTPKSALGTGTETKPVLHEMQLRWYLADTFVDPQDSADAGTKQAKNVPSC